MRQSIPWLATLLCLLLGTRASAQPTVLDAFESADGWKVITAEGVTLSVTPEPGTRGNCLRLDYNFVTGAGYCIIQKSFPLKLPENYEFAFQLRGEGPANNLEFKLLDTTGDNVWWLNRRALEWPHQWTRMVNKKRAIEFAWGPSAGTPLAQVSKIEFAIASNTGGKGSVWLDELTFRELPPENHEPLKPTASATSDAGPLFQPANVLDGDPTTLWRSGPAQADQPQTLTLDLGRVAEFGGLEVDWDPAAVPAGFTAESSDDGIGWTPLIGRRRPRAGSLVLPTPDAEARFVRLSMTSFRNGSPVGVREVRVMPPAFGESPNAFFTALAAEAPRGRYPRSFSNEQSYWTIIGVDGDDAEALINEEGAVELSKRGPTIEPFITVGSKLLTWADGEHTQSLEKDYLPIPTVVRRHKNEQLELAITVFADGAPGDSILWITYRLKNLSAPDGQSRRGTLHAALRPFQVNPPWQRLNNEGGFAQIHSVLSTGDKGPAALMFNQSVIQAVAAKGRSGAATFEDGDVAAWFLLRPTLADETIEDADGRASGEISFDFDLAPGAEQEFSLRSPMHGGFADPTLSSRPPSFVTAKRSAAAQAWNEKLSRATITVPKSDQWIADTFKSQLAYILINRDGPAIQPGSRSYERSWARDGSMTSAALLACGHPEEVRAWIDWFGAHQFDSGKVPCVVDKRGPDPVPEYDSQGEYIWAVANYYRYTHDQAFLKTHWPRVQKAVAYIQSLRAQRMTSEYAAPNSPKHAFYGLVPESISHEGYSAKPMHSYWDDFFILLGLKEAAYLAAQVNSTGVPPVSDYQSLAQDFRKCLYDSMHLAMAAQKIDYIPGCVELGDFDSTSTTIALFPCDELEAAPEPALRNTFNQYWQFFKARSSPGAEWDAYTPYEIRHVGAFVRLGEPDKAHALLNWFHQYQRPQAWNHWAEVVWHDPKTPKFIGDMPHTWVGSDFLNSVCSIFVYERADSLVVFAGVPREWVDSGEPIAFQNLVTPRGKLSGSLQRQGQAVKVTLQGDLQLPPGGILVRHPPTSTDPDATVHSLPTELTFTLPTPPAPTNAPPK